MISEKSPHLVRLKHLISILLGNVLCNVRVDSFYSLSLHVLPLGNVNSELDERPRIMSYGCLQIASPP